MREISGKKARWILAAILLAVVGVYVRTLGYGYLPGFDDELYLLNRPEVQDWWQASWYHRLLTPETGYSVAVPTVVYASARALLPEAFPQVLHGVNLGLHLVNVVLVYALGRRWLGRTGALAVAGIWGLHPVNVETVAWLTNLKGLFFATGTLGSLLIWDRHLDAESTGKVDWSVAGALLAIFALTLLSRPDAIVIPILLVMMTVWRTEGLGPKKTLGLIVGLQIAGVVAYMPVAVANQGVVVGSSGASGASGAWEMYVRVTRALGVSARNVVFPFDLDPAYYLTTNESFVGTLPGLVIGVCLLAVGAGLAIGRRWKLFFFWMFLGISYGPYSQIVSLPRLTADSYLYVPTVAALLLVAAALQQGRSSERQPEQPSAGRTRTLLVGLVVTVGLVFGVQTFHQAGRWENLLTLWKPVLVEQPRVWRPYVHIGRAYMERGEFEKAAATLDRGLPVLRASHFYPDYMAMVYDRVGRPKKALELSIEGIMRGREVGDFEYQTFLGLLARHRFELPQTEQMRELVEEAVEVYVGHEDWMSQRANRLLIADYLSQSGYPAQAVPFLRRELQAEAVHCRFFQIVERLPAEESGRLDVPSVPSRCQR